MHFGEGRSGYFRSWLQLSLCYCSYWFIVFGWSLSALCRTIRLVQVTVFHHNETCKKYYTTLHCLGEIDVTKFQLCHILFFMGSSYGKMFEFWRLNYKWQTPTINKKKWMNEHDKCAIKLKDCQNVLVTILGVATRWRYFANNLTWRSSEWWFTGHTHPIY